jgi:hypothetical protein
MSEVVFAMLTRLQIQVSSPRRCTHGMACRGAGAFKARGITWTSDWPIESSDGALAQMISKIGSLRVPVAISLASY